MSNSRLLRTFGAPVPVIAIAVLMVLAHALRLYWGASGTALSFDVARLSGDSPTVLRGLSAVVTHVFVHGDVAHLLLNTAALYIAGREVSSFGSARGAVVLFFAAAAAGVLAHAVFYGPGIALFGASAGVAGLMATWLRLMVRNMRVFVALALFWLVLNYPGVEGAPAGVTLTAWEAHLGGFLFGLIAGPFIMRHVR